MSATFVQHWVRVLLRSCFVATGISPLFSQGIRLVGAGYANPTAITVSPGQITTIFVSGLQPDFSMPPTATTLPLPNTLAGISVTINGGSPKQSFVAPLLNVVQSNNCSGSVFAPTQAQPSPIPQDCLLTRITLQIPYELPTGGSAEPSAGELVISTNGVTSKAFSVAVASDNMHVLTTCDAKQGGVQIVNNCTPIVTHADGTPVSADSPANSGETIVVYAYGLGRTTPAVPSGQATPTPAPILGPSIPPFIVRAVLIAFDFQPNAGPSNPYMFNLAPTGRCAYSCSTGDAAMSKGGSISRSSGFTYYKADDTPSNPVPFVGLTPGQVGLYQVNVQLPATFPSVLPCGNSNVPNSVTGGSTSYSVQSNLTINIYTGVSLDGAAICVQPTN